MIFIAAPQNAGFKNLLSHSQINAGTGVHAAAGNFSGNMGKPALSLRRGDGKGKAPLPFCTDAELPFWRGKNR